MRPLEPRLLREAPSAAAFLGACVALAGLTAAATIAQAVLLGRVVADAFLRDRGLDALGGPLVALAALAVVRGALAWALESGGHLASARVTAQLRRRLAVHVLRARPGGLGDLRSGELATTAVTGVDALDPYFSRFLPQLVLATVVPPAILAWVFLHDLESGLVMAVTLPLIPIFGILIGKAAEQRTLARWEALARMSAHFLDVVRGLPTLRAFRRGRAQVETIARVTDAYRRETLGTLRVAFLSALVLELAATLGTAVVAVEIGVRLVAGHVALAPALAILVLAPELYGPLRAVAAQFHASTDGLAAAGRIFEVLDLPPAVAVPERPVAPPDPSAASVRLERVGVVYPGRKTPALAGVSLELSPGERVALSGRSGAGKSTLLSLLLRFLEPGAGRILVGDVDLATVDPDGWRRLVAWVPQRPRLQPGSIADAIRAGVAADDESVHAATRAAGAAAFVEALPNGYATSVGEGAPPLSAGQVRRLALARAFLRRAPLLLLDEPTAHLDAEASRAVAAALERLPRSQTVLLVTHDPQLLGIADRTLALERGLLLSAGASGSVA